MFGRRRLLPFAICMALLAAPAAAAPSSATVNATVKASVVKPLSLTALQDLDLGTIALGSGSWSGATVSISRTGVFSCANVNTTCSGARQVARLSGCRDQQADRPDHRAQRDPRQPVRRHKDADDGHGRTGERRAAELRKPRHRLFGRRLDHAQLGDRRRPLLRHHEHHRRLSVAQTRRAAAASASRFRLRASWLMPFRYCGGTWMSR